MQYVLQTKTKLFWALSAGTTTFSTSIVDNVFATSGSLKTDVALTLFDLLNTSIRFKIKTSHPLPLWRVVHGTMALLKGLYGDSYLMMF